MRIRFTGCGLKRRDWSRELSRASVIEVVGIAGACSAPERMDTPATQMPEGRAVTQRSEVQPNHAETIEPLRDTDWATLEQSSLLGRLTDAERMALRESVEVVVEPAGVVILREGEPFAPLRVIVDGTAQFRHGNAVWRTVKLGEPCGLPIPDLPSPRSIDTITTVRVVRLPDERLAPLTEKHPALLTHLFEGAVVNTLSAMPINVDELQQRFVARQPRPSSWISRFLEATKRARDVLPAEVGGAMVVATLVNRRPASLDSPVLPDATIEPVTLASIEGRGVFARCAGLMLLEAIARVAPTLEVHMGEDMGWAQVATVEADLDLRALSRRLTEELRVVSREHIPFREEDWLVDEARRMFETRGWKDAALLLATWREPTVRLAGFGSIYALESGPMLANSGEISGLRVLAHPDGLLLDFGEGFLEQVAQQLHHGATATRDALIRELPLPRARDGERGAHGILSNASNVGDLNQRCISGAVDQLIRTCEGFHEKRISQLADAILARRGRTRLISIAGPSSSGKTTVIKRLSVQLEINGIHPVSLSIDDYFKDRAKAPPQASGEDYYFETVDAIDVDLLRRQIEALRAGRTVRVARFDFVTGKSEPEGGPELHLEPDDLLVLEGIHAASRGIIGDLRSRSEVFSIFVYLVHTLPLDRLTCVRPDEVRLLRRIVRDRRLRGRSAAENIAHRPALRGSELLDVFPSLNWADAVFDSSLPYELSVLKIYANRYLLEVPMNHPSYPIAYRLRRLVDRFVTIYPDQIPPTSILREFIGGSGFEY